MPLLVLYLIAHVCTCLEAAKQPPRRYCELKGIVYVTDNVKKANYLVFQEESQFSAEVWVYEENNSLFADRAGIWYFTNNIHEADFVIYYVARRRDADFSVFFLASPTFAGCPM